MKVMTILGTRPEIIRLSLIMPKLDRWAERHIIVHTGQNFAPSLSGRFFQELGLRAPDYILQSGTHSLGGQLSAMFAGLEPLLLREAPDKVLLLGDTNSALSAILAERMGIPVIHMEAGNRCFDLEVPEEKNRRVIDAISSVNMPYTEHSRRNLLREGLPPSSIVVTGNPIYEVLTHYEPQIAASPILDTLGLEPGGYFAATAHRAENVDRPERLLALMNGLNGVAEAFGLRIVCSVHPRTRSRIDRTPGLAVHPLVEFHEPFGFFDFVRLERHARCVLTDSGTVQEECCIFHVPAVTMRRSTERPETVECGSNVVTGLSPERIVAGVRQMTGLPNEWPCPEGYLDPHVSAKVVKYVLGGK